MKNNKQSWFKFIKALEGAYSPHTLRAYRCDFERFEQWCQTNTTSALPASPAAVAKFVADDAKTLKPSSVKRRLTSIRKIHRLCNFEDPTANQVVETAIRRARRGKLARPKQALGLTEELRDRLIASFDNTVIGLRDRAMVAVGYDTLCRRSELVGLRVEDISCTGRGARILVRRAKNDPFGSGRIAAISTTSLKTLDRWLEMAGIEQGAIFRPVYRGKVIDRSLHPYTVTRILKQLAKRAGLDASYVERISSHSMRVGAAQDLMLTGHGILTIMRAGGWRSMNVVGRYVENVDLQIWD